MMVIGTVKLRAAPVTGSKLPPVPRRRAVSVLSALGVSADDERRYQQVLPFAGSSVREIGTLLGVDPDQVPVTLAGLIDLGVVRIVDGRVAVLRNDQILSAAITREAEAAVQVRERLDDLARAVPLLVAAGSRPAPGEVQDVRALDGEMSAGGNALELLTALIEQSRGDLLFLRPDTWLMPRESAISRGGRPRGRVGPALAGDLPAPRPARGAGGAADADRRGGGGPADRRPADPALRDQRDPRDPPRAARLRRRAAAARPPGRPGRRAHPALRAVLGEGSRRSPSSRARARRARRSSSASSASGAKDEQIARTMGLSLRTVRRRIAELMIELGADTRFQAGAEAARRGWL